MIKQYYRDFSIPIHLAGKELKEKGKVVYPKKWQATQIDRGMREIFNYEFTCQISSSIKKLKKQIEPDLPWSDKHFKERVSREPLNPPPSYIDWPYYQDDKKWRTEGEKFSHSYPERIWTPEIQGIRYRHGNLDDVIDLLLSDPLTRQAFLPMFFPEDTGAHHGERIPCSIGWQFFHRDDKLSIFYPIRSCDYRRHFRNDIYMAARLTLWVLEELRKRDNYWDDIHPGTLTMQIWNLHCFEHEERFL